MTLYASSLAQIKSYVEELTPIRGKPQVEAVGRWLVYSWYNGDSLQFVRHPELGDGWEQLEKRPDLSRWKVWCTGCDYLAMLSRDELTAIRNLGCSSGCARAKARVRGEISYAPQNYIEPKEIR